MIKPVTKSDLVDFNIGLTQDIKYVNQYLKINADKLLRGESVTIQLDTLNSQPIIDAFSDFEVMHSFHRNESYLVFKLK